MQKRRNKRKPHRNLNLHAMQWLTCCRILINDGSGLNTKVIIEELMQISDGHSILEAIDPVTAAADR